MCKYKCGLGFAKLFSGERIRKTETTVFEIRRGFWVSPARRRGREESARASFFWILAGDKILKQYYIFYF
ncbi:MAG: hypothetical protein COV70_02555 [Parcubacteria group bacterium CG11_big_fil_rev_8_21_14_0_20_39_22]|nr:MAG: hypothetical protein COV70_02555 [Parcubacteria group bacterium CG11_big_fil_rev_8_21_14_0_20_39_22]